MALDCLDGIVVRVVRLDHHPPSPETSTCSTCNLLHQLEGPLCSPKIGQIECCVGRDHTNHRHQRKIQALGNHLRPHQHIRLPSRETLKNVPVSLCRACCVTIPTHQPRFRPALPHRLLDTLSPQPKVTNATTSTPRTFTGRRFAMIAMMTGQHSLTPVDRQRHIAVGTAHNISTVTTEYKCGLSAAVQEEDHLFSAIQSLAHRSRQCSAKDRPVTCP